MALIAATVAWFAVQNQINVGARIAEEQRRDAAVIRLLEHHHKLIQCNYAWVEFRDSSDYDQREKYEALKAVLLAARGIPYDPLFGKDEKVVSEFLDSAIKAARAKMKFESTKELEDKFYDAQMAVFDCIDARLLMLREGSSVASMVERHFWED